jgi:hypothetical protein
MDRKQPANSGAPAVLVAFGENDLYRLSRGGIAGAYVGAWQWKPAGGAPQLFEAAE